MTRRLAALLAVLLLLLAPLARAADNELTDAEKKDGWILLFDGKSVDGWKCGDKPRPAKQVENGTLNVLDQGVYVSHYDRKFADFHFSCDYKFDKTTNSGLFFHIPKPNDPGRVRGFEIQDIDSYGTPTSRFECGALYEFLAPTKQ